MGYEWILKISVCLPAFYQATAQPVAGDAKLLMNKLSPVFSTWKSLLQVFGIDCKGKFSNVHLTYTRLIDLN